MSTLTIVRFEEVDVDTFDLYYLDAFNKSQNVEENCSVLDSDGEPEGSRYYLDRDNRAGFTIRADGELVFVHSLTRGLGDALVDVAVRLGAVYLDCFAGHLTDLYSRHGFETVATVPNWTAGGPDVALMALPGYSSRHGVTA